MKKRTTGAFFGIVISIIFIVTDSFAAWTQAKGHAYNQLSYSYYITKEKFTTVVTEKTGTTVITVTDCGTFQSEGEEVKGVGSEIKRKDTPKFESHSVSYFVMYGITDTLSVMLNIPYKWAVSDDTKKYACENGPSGIGDINLTLRYNLTQNLFGSGTLMSVDGALKIPEAYKYGYPLSHLSLGDGQYDATLSLVFGRGLGKAYAILSTGYKYRFENKEFDPYTFKPSDQIKARIDIGYSVIPKIELRLNADWTKSTGNASVSQELIIDNYNYGGLAKHGDSVLIRETLGLEPDDLNLGVGVAYKITQRSQAVISYNVDVWGKDYALGHMPALALVYMF